MLLGIDLGTSGIKSVLCDEEGRLVASASASLRISRPRPGWSEQDPADWIAALRSTLLQLKAGHDLSAVRAIGLSGQMHGATCLDRQGKIIRPAILWNDTRAEKEARILDAREDLKAVLGNITFAGFTAPKILWMRQHEPENAAAIEMVLLPKDYLRLWLTGEYVSDMSDASGTAWLDIAARDWSDKLLDASGLQRHNMPRLIEGSAASGIIRKEIAAEFALPANTIIAGGGGDNAATAIGLGVLQPGKGFVSLGTSGVVFAANAAFLPDPARALHAFCHAVPETWHQMAVTLSATDCLNWHARHVGEKPAELVNRLGELKAPSDEVFLPFPGGERTPYNNGNLRAGFFGMGHDTNADRLTASVLEGVSFSLLECIHLMEASAGKMETLLAVGGGAQSDYWMRLLATIFARPVLRPRNAENAAAMGAAILAGMSVGASPEVELDCQQFDPQSGLIEAFGQKFKTYKAFAEFANQQSRT